MKNFEISEKHRNDFDWFCECPNERAFAKKLSSKRSRAEAKKFTRFQMEQE
jgi:hypothetical protein